MNGGIWGHSLVFEDGGPGIYSSSVTSQVRSVSGESEIKGRYLSQQP